MRKQIELNVPAPGFWRATFTNPPINLIDPGTISELVAKLESDPDAKAIVFESSDPDFFLAHYDVLVDKARTAAMPQGPTGMHPWLDVLVRLSRAPVVSIASIRGRARGAGSEFALSCDVRFASAQKAVLGQFEVGVGAVPGGNPMARLAGLMGRGRAIEVVLGADDFPGVLAERYGYVNRTIPDEDLDAFAIALPDGSQDSTKRRSRAPSGLSTKLPFQTIISSRPPLINSSSPPSARQQGRGWQSF